MKMTWHHAGLNVSDVDRSIRWYRDVLGFRYVARDELLDGVTVVWLEHDGFYLELFGRAEPVFLDPETEYSSIGTRHVCLCLPPEDFTALRERFLELRVPIVMEMHHPPEEVGRPGGLRCMFVTDPDGIRLEFLEDFIPGSYGTNLPTEI